MSAYEDDAGKLCEHIPEECDDPFCQICIEAEREEAASGFDPKDDYRK